MDKSNQSASSEEQTEFSPHEHAEAFLRNSENTMADLRRQREDCAARRGQVPATAVSLQSAGYGTSSSACSNNEPMSRAESEARFKQVDQKIAGHDQRLESAEGNIQELMRLNEIYEKHFRDALNHLRDALDRAKSVRRALTEIAKIARNLQNYPLKNYITKLIKTTLDQLHSGGKDDELEKVTAGFQRFVDLANEMIRSDCIAKLKQERANIKDQAQSAPEAAVSTSSAINYMTMIGNITKVSGELVELARKTGKNSSGEELLRKGEEIQEIAKKLEKVLQKFDDSSSHSGSEESYVEQMILDNLELSEENAQLRKRLEDMTIKYEQSIQQTRNADNSSSTSPKPPIDRPDELRQRVDYTTKSKEKDERIAELKAHRDDLREVIADLKVDKENLRKQITNLEAEVQKLADNLVLKTREACNLEEKRRTLEEIVDNSVSRSQHVGDCRLLADTIENLARERFRLSNENTRLENEITRLETRLDQLTNGIASNRRPYLSDEDNDQLEQEVEIIHNLLNLLDM